MLETLPSSMTGVLKEREKEKDKDRDCRDTSTAQGTPKDC